MVLTFGLLSPNKGIEYMLRALPEVVKTCRTGLYRARRDPPDLVREQGETYRLSLERLAGISAFESM